MQVIYKHNTHTHTHTHSPRTHVTPSPHESSQREPQRVGKGEVVGVSKLAAVALLFNLPFIWREPGDDKENHGDTQVAGNNAVPDGPAEWLHEGEYSRLLLFRFLDHDGDAQVHKRLAKVNKLCAFCVDGEWGDSHVCFLGGGRCGW